MANLSFEVMRDGIIRHPVFQAACQRYAHGGGSSEAYMRAQGVLTPQHDVLTGDDLDQAVDAVMVWSGKEGAK